MHQAQNQSPPFTICYIAVGSNLPSLVGSVADTIGIALELLKESDIDIIRQSRFFITPAYPLGAGPDFINAVAMIRTRLAALPLLAALHRIETQLGRTRTRRWGARVLDLDLLSFGDAVLPDIATYEVWRQMPAASQAERAPEQLILPHPRMHERGFVLVPMLDIAPHWRHPVLGHSVTEMVRALDPSLLAGIKPFKG